LSDGSVFAQAFGDHSAGVPSTTQYAGIYNSGNQPLTLSDIEISGLPFNLLPGATNNGTVGMVIAPGASCEVGLAITPQQAGAY
jgi:hypothetical protein